MCVQRVKASLMSRLWSVFKSSSKLTDKVHNNVWYSLYSHDAEVIQLVIVYKTTKSIILYYYILYTVYYIVFHELDSSPATQSPQSVICLSDGFFLTVF